MTTNPESAMPSAWVSDKLDLDELFRDAKPVGDNNDWALPGFFESDGEFDDFQAWLRAERASDIA